MTDTVDAQNKASQAGAAAWSELTPSTICQIPSIAGKESVAANSLFFCLFPRQQAERRTAAAAIPTAVSVAAKLQAPAR
ncbi:hypothetical protein ABBQ32_003678 [Trebouxia sp. C0010 RCD-2024]